MGEAAGKKGVWAYVEGGMGAISNAIAASAREAGALILTNATVDRILYEGDRATGVLMEDGTELHAPMLLSNATPYHTFLELLPGLARDSGFEEESPLPRDFQKHIRHVDFSCGAFKINCAVDKLPNYECAEQHGWDAGAAAYGHGSLREPNGGDRVRVPRGLHGDARNAAHRGAHMPERD